MIPQDQLQKIQWALCKELSGDTISPNQYPTQGIMTLKDSDPRHIPKEQHKRGRRTNLEALKSIGALLIKS